MVLTGENGYHSWALHLKALTGVMVSRVALWKRMGKELAACLQAILEQTFHTRLSAPYLTGKTKKPFSATY